MPGDGDIQAAIEQLEEAGYTVKESSLGGYRLTWPSLPGQPSRQELVTATFLVQVAETAGALLAGIEGKEGFKFRPAPAVEEISRVLISEYHSHLVEARIGYLWRDGGWASRGKAVLGKAYKIADREKIFSEQDFVIVINAEAWQGLSPEQHTALVDHELSHCGCSEDKDGNRTWTIWPHDVEEFRAIIDRHGLWEPDLRKFGEAAARKYQQLELPIEQAVIDDILRSSRAAETGPEFDDTTVTISSGGRTVETTGAGLRHAAEMAGRRRGGDAA